MRALMVALCLSVGMAGLELAPSYGAETKQVTTQQEKMKTCNTEAAAKKLSGDARKTFMSSCLSSKTTAGTGTTQQEKMKTCNTEASAKKLSGEARKTFMSSCLKG